MVAAPPRANFFKNASWWAPLFFVLYGGWGFITLSDFGVGLDELTQRAIGMENNRFLSGRVGFDKVQEHGLFGPIWESLCYLAEQIYFPGNMRFKLLLHRGMLWCLFLGSCWSLYRWFYRRNSTWMEVGSFQHYWTSLLPSALLMTWPRLFADAHHNSKDVLFLSLMVWIWIGLDTIWQGKTVKRWSLIWPWLLLGIDSTIRLSGLLVFGCALLISALQWVSHGKLFSANSDEDASETKASLGWANLRRAGLGWVGLGWADLGWSEFRNRIFIPMVLFVLGYVATYPYLWVKGWSGFVEILQFGTQNPWKHPTLFLGDWVNTETDGQPMFYLPVWILVTISEWILVVLLAVLLHVWPSNRVWKQPIVFFSLLVLMAFLGYTVVFQPVLYNGWRHLYFLVVPLITFIGIGASAINHKRLIPIHLLLAGYCIFSIIEPNKEDIQKGKLSLGYVSASSDFNVLARLFMDDKQKSKDELTSVDVAGPDIHTMDTGKHVRGVSELDENVEGKGEPGGSSANPRFKNLCDANRCTDEPFQITLKSNRKIDNLKRDSNLDSEGKMNIGESVAADKRLIRGSKSIIRGSTGISGVIKWSDGFPFSGDYWQHTTLQAYQFLLKKFPRSWIIVSGKGEGLWLNSLLLPEADRNRIRFCSMDGLNTHVGSPNAFPVLSANEVVNWFKTAKESNLKERVWIWVVFNEEGVVQVPDIGDGRVVADAFRGNHWLWRAYQPQIQ
jgi:hypothetical protein